MEEYLPGRTDNLHDYLIPTFGDVPEIESILIEKPDPEGPSGARGLGEHVLIPTAPAILNAIRHATGAVLDRVPGAAPPRPRRDPRRRGHAMRPVREASGPSRRPCSARSRGANLRRARGVPRNPTLAIGARMPLGAESRPPWGRARPDLSTAKSGSPLKRNAPPVRRRSEPR